jgi:hypothetical protein
VIIVQFVVFLILIEIQVATIHIWDTFGNTSAVQQSRSRVQLLLWPVLPVLSTAVVAGRLVYFFWYGRANLLQFMQAEWDLWEQIPLYVHVFRTHAIGDCNVFL